MAEAKPIDDATVPCNDGSSSDIENEVFYQCYENGDHLTIAQDGNSEDSLFKTLNGAAGAAAVPLPTKQFYPGIEYHLPRNSPSALVKVEGNGDLSPNSSAIKNGQYVFSLEECVEADSVFDDGLVGQAMAGQQPLSPCSELSWCSSFSTESQQDERDTLAKQFMEGFVNKVFTDSTLLTQSEKAQFGELCRYSSGRLWFAKLIDAQRCHSQKVSEQTFYRLVQFIAICLFECNYGDDFIPAKTLMNMCFTFFHEHEGFPKNESTTHRGYLFNYLKEQPIWRSLRFWNAAFFEAVNQEREQRSPVERSNSWRQMTSEERVDCEQLNENITFGQLATFTNNMMDFGLTQQLCLQFVDKQSIIGNLSREQIDMIKNNIKRLDQAKGQTCKDSSTSVSHNNLFSGLKLKLPKSPHRFQKNSHKDQEN